MCLQSPESRLLSDWSKNKRFFFQNSTLTYIWLSVLFEKFTSQVCQQINTIFNSRPEGYKRNKRTLEWIQSIIVYYYCFLCLYSPMQQFLCYDQSLRSFITHTKKSCLSGRIFALFWRTAGIHFAHLTPDSRLRVVSTGSVQNAK